MEVSVFSLSSVRCLQKWVIITSGHKSSFTVLSATFCSNLNAGNSYFIIYKIEMVKPPDRESKSYTAKGL
jgi:hypothetical protein